MYDSSRTYRRLTERSYCWSYTLFRPLACSILTDRYGLAPLPASEDLESPATISWILTLKLSMWRAGNPGKRTRSNDYKCILNKPSSSQVIKIAFSTSLTTIPGSGSVSSPLAPTLSQRIDRARGDWMLIGIGSTRSCSQDLFDASSVHVLLRDFRWAERSRGCAP